MNRRYGDVSNVEERRGEERRGEERRGEERACLGCASECRKPNAHVWGRYC